MEERDKDKGRKEKGREWSNLATWQPLGGRKSKKGEREISLKW